LRRRRARPSFLKRALLVSLSFKKKTLLRVKPCPPNKKKEAEQSLFTLKSKKTGARPSFFLRRPSALKKDRSKFYFFTLLKVKFPSGAKSSFPSYSLCFFPFKEGKGKKQSASKIKFFKKSQRAN